MSGYSSRRAVGHRRAGRSSATPRTVLCAAAGTIAAAAIILAATPSPALGQPVIDRTRLARYFPTLATTDSVRVVSRTADSAMSEAGDRVRLTPGVYVAVSPPLPARQTIDAGLLKYALPDRYVGVDETGTQEVVLSTVLLVSRVLRWTGEAGGFQGRVLVGVDDSLSATSRELAPIGGVVVAPRADSVGPPSFTITRTNAGGLREIALTSRDPGDSLQITLITDLDRGGRELRLPVERPTLTVETASRRIRGLGLEEAEVRVLLQGATGPASVGLSADNGYVAPGPLVVEPGTIATSTIRSRGWDSAVVVAGRPSFVAGSTVIRYYFPVLFLTLTLVGGLVGGLLRALHARKGDESADYVRSAAAGVLAGLVLGVAFGIGIRFDWLPVPANVTELGAALLAAIGGYAGPAAMKTLTPGGAEP